MTAVAAPTGFCDVSPGEYTAWTGTDTALESADVFSAGVSQARCLKDIRNLGGFVVEDVFKDGKGRYADELGSYGKLMHAWPGEPANSVCNALFPVGKRNVPTDLCASTTYTSKSYVETASYAGALDWKFVKPVRYDPTARIACPASWPAMGCFGDRCYDGDCVNADGSLKFCPAGQICKKGACTPGSATSLPFCKGISNSGATGTRVANGSNSYYNPWDGLVFDLGGRASKVAIFAINDHGPQPCESNELTVYLTNDPSARDFIEDPARNGPSPNKWNRAKLYKIYTHGWIDNPDCCASPRSCDPTKCALPKPGDKPLFEGDAMALVYALPCGVAFRYAAVIAGYDGKSLGDPTKGYDRCTYHSFDAEIDAVAGLTDDETAICPDKDGDGFPSCDCSPKPSPCDCIDDPAVNPEAAKYFPGAAQSCDGPQYSCAPTVCPTGTSCINSQCLKPCDSGEFKCPAGFTCESKSVDGGAKADVCVPAPCGDAGACPTGASCKSGMCVDLCAPPTSCPPGHVCKSGACLDPCGLVKCPAGEICQAGKCVLPCACLASTAAGYPCVPPTGSCDVKTNTCVAPGCEKTTCPAGKVCVGTPAGPACKGTCEDVVCPGKTVCDPVKGCVDKCSLLATPCSGATPVCSNGVCVDAACANVECDALFVCREGKCVESDAGVLFDAGTMPDATPDDADPLEDASKGDSGWGVQSPDKEAGCRCSAPGRSSANMLLLVGLTFAAGAFARRRRR